MRTTINERELAARLYTAFGADAFYGVRVPETLQECIIRAKGAVYAVAFQALGVPAPGAEIALDVLGQQLEELLKATKTIWNALPAPTHARCGDCGTISPIDELMEIDDLDERLDVGPTTGPVGECPRARSDNPEDPDPCGALSYPTWEEPADDKSA